MVEPTSIAVELELAGAGAGWTDVTADVRAQVPIRVRYGITSGGGPRDRCAQPGAMTFALDNSNGNAGAAAGYYSPGHASARAGFDLGIGVRLTIVYAGVTYHKFRGRLGVVQVQPDPHGPRMVLCTAYDWFDDALRARLKQIAVQVDKRGDELFDVLVAAMPVAPDATTKLGQGRETYALALDAKSGEGLPVLAELQRLALSEAGYIYPRGTVAGGAHGTGSLVVYESRTDRAKNNVSLTTLSDADVERVRIGRYRDGVINRIQVATHPRRKDGAAVALYQLRDATATATSSVVLPAGASHALTCLYTDPENRRQRCAGVSMVTPTSGAGDFTANDAADGTGTDRTSSLGVAATFGGTSAAVTLTNNHSAAIYCTALRLRGQGIYDDTTTIAEHEDATSQTTYGQTAYRYNAAYQTDPGIGDSFARHFLGLQKDAQQSVEAVTINANRSAALLTAALAREPGHRVEIATDLAAVDEGYFIQSVALDIRPRRVISCTWSLTPASRIAYWFVGTAGASEVGETTVLGF